MKITPCHLVLVVEKDKFVIHPPEGKALKIKIMKAVGSQLWVIAEGYIPGQSSSQQYEFISHETACILNTGDEDAHVEIMLFFTDREPAGSYRLTVPARRTKHLRFNELKDPAPVPRDTDYSTVITSDVPIVVQHTRLDSRRSENALISTIAYSDTGN